MTCPNLRERVNAWCAAAFVVALTLLAAKLCGCATLAHDVTAPAAPPVYASDAECSAAGYPPRIYVHGVFAYCPQDPTADMGPVSDFARRRRDAGVADGH